MSYVYTVICFDKFVFGESLIEEGTMFVNADVLLTFHYSFIGVVRLYVFQRQEEPVVAEIADHSLL